MNLEDAEKVVALILEADGGCPYCAKELCDGFAGTFPEHKELAERKYKERYGSGD